jgi:B12-binding domain/radical SAM domain protein
VKNGKRNTADGKQIDLVFYYTQLNRWSLNALLGAVEDFEYLNISFATNGSSLFQELEGKAQAVVAISCMTSQWNETRALAVSLRRKFEKRVLLVAGGPHPSALPEECVRAGFDVCVCGEGEAVFPALLKAIHQDDPFASIPGIAYLDGDTIRITPRPPPIQLDDYSPFSVRHKKVGPIEITRGCPFVCGYCQTSHLFGTRPRHRSIPVILRHVESMKKNHLRFIRVISPNAFSYGSTDGRTLNLPALSALLHELRQTVTSPARLFFGSFPSEVRPEHVTDETVELVTRYADNDNLVLGAQTGSPRLLQACGRTHTVDDVIRAVRRIIRAKMKANVDFIFGLPGETEDDVRETLELIQELVALGACIHAHRFSPLPQTGFAQKTPTPLTPEMIRSLQHMASTGQLFGQWKTQPATQ